jgi:steroid delta-isomerase
MANTEAQIKHVYEGWHEATKARDVPGLGALYAEDATFESASVLTVWSDHGSGVLHGRAEIAKFLGEVYRKGIFGQWYRTATYFSNGRQLIWEYPRETPDGQQTDLVEVMELEDGLIVRHRVYWGWYGVQALVKKLK